MVTLDGWFVFSFFCSCFLRVWYGIPMIQAEMCSLRRGRWAVASGLRRFIWLNVRYSDEYIMLQHNKINDGTTD